MTGAGLGLGAYAVARGRTRKTRHCRGGACMDAHLEDARRKEISAFAENDGELVALVLSEWCGQEGEIE